MNDNIKILKQKVKQFRDERDWKQFHNPKNLSMALSVETSELAEIFLWATTEESYNIANKKIEAVKEEIADVFIYLLSLSDVLNIDLQDAVENKLIKNCKKYPIDKAKGSCKKYTEL